MHGFCSTVPFFFPHRQHQSQRRRGLPSKHSTQHTTQKLNLHSTASTATFNAILWFAINSEWILFWSLPLFCARLILFRFVKYEWPRGQLPPANWTQSQLNAEPTQACGRLGQPQKQLLHRVQLLWKLSSPLIALCYTPLTSESTLTSVQLVLLSCSHVSGSQ